MLILTHEHTLTWTRADIMAVHLNHTHQDMLTLDPSKKEDDTGDQNMLSMWSREANSVLCASRLSALCPRAVACYTHETYTMSKF